MVFFQADWSRLVLIFVVGLFLTIMFLFISYKILTRHRDRLTLTLSSFYIAEALGFLTNVIYSFLMVNPIVTILLFITYYLVVFGFIFIVIFLLNLVKMYIKIKIQLIIICTYAVSVFLVLSIPGGMTINENTNWRPIYSWTLVFGVSILISSFILIPTIILSIKTYKIFEDENLRRKLKYFLIGIFGMIIISYGALINMALNDPGFSLLWSFISLLVVPSGIMIYYGIGHSI